MGVVEGKSILEGLEWLHSLGDPHFSSGEGDNLKGNMIRRSEESDL